MIIIRIPSELLKAKVLFPNSAIWKWVVINRFKESPHVEVVNAAITIDVMTGSTLAQTKKAEPIRIWERVFLSLT